MLCVLAGLLLATYLGINEGIRTGAFAQAWRRGKTHGAEIRAEGEERRQRDLAWMERHWATRWCARLNRRLLG
ncbi:MAG TPA: hypothetical protein VNF29_01280 [Candidatus Binataceae bacterium]|nr:hypothetical protein [Candidatus Binataceae bacterium]